MNTIVEPVAHISMSKRATDPPAAALPTGAPERRPAGLHSFHWHTCKSPQMVYQLQCNLIATRPSLQGADCVQDSHSFVMLNSRCWEQVAKIEDIIDHLKLMPEEEISRKISEMQKHRWRFIFKVPILQCCGPMTIDCFAKSSDRNDHLSLMLHLCVRKQQYERLPCRQQWWTSM